MNRRDAIAALVSLPAAARLSAAQVAPTDVVIVECEQSLTMSAAARIRTDLGKVWPGREIVVCDKGLPHQDRATLKRKAKQRKRQSVDQHEKPATLTYRRGK